MYNKNIHYKKVPPFMFELTEIYNICYGALNKIERCFFGKTFKNPNKKDVLYHICIIHYQLCNNEKVYKISYVQDDLQISSAFFEKNWKFFICDDASIGCIFRDDKLRIDIFKNESLYGNFNLNCINTNTCNDMHKNFIFNLGENFCSFNSNNTLLIYCAEGEDNKTKELNYTQQHLDTLKKINNDVCVETYGEKHNYSYFYIYVYNLRTNSIKYITTKDITYSFYNPQFIDDSSFICLAYRSLPFRLGIHNTNTRTNELYICTLSRSDISCTINENILNKKKFIKGAWLKISDKNTKHICSPIIIKDNKNYNNIYIACLVHFYSDDKKKKSNIMKYNLVLYKIISIEDIKKKTFISKYEETGYEDDYNKNINHMFNNEYVKRYEEISENEENGELIEINHMNIFKNENEKYNRLYDISRNDMNNLFSPNSKKRLNMNQNQNFTEEMNSSNDHIKKKKNLTSSNIILKEIHLGNEDICNYKKVSTEVLIKAETTTYFFHGIHTNELKGYIYPYIFLNTIFYCNKIIIGVNILTKKIYKVLISSMCEAYDMDASVEILSIKKNNILVNVNNMLLNSVIIHCVFDEKSIKEDFIYLVSVKSYNLDMTKYDINKTDNIIYSGLNDNFFKLYLILNELETSNFLEKHPYIRRKHYSFNLLYEKEKLYLNQIKQYPSFLPNFNLYNKRKYRNLIVFLCEDFHAYSLNVYKNSNIYFAACGFDLLYINCVEFLINNYEQERTSSSNINKVFKAIKGFIDCFNDYEDIYLYGYSLGAYTAFYLLIEYPNYFKSCCLVNGLYDLLLSYFTSDVPDVILNNYSKILNDNSFENNYNLKSCDYEKLYINSPINFLQHINTPILLICGIKDMRISYYNSLFLYKKLLSLNKTCKLIAYKNSNHNIEENFQNIECMLINIILWFYGYETKKK